MKKISKWFKFTKAEIKNIPTENGVYKIRSKEELNRVKGSSKIIYYGINTGNTTSFRDRLNQHISGNSSPSKYLNILRKNLELEFAFCEMNNKSNIKKWEQKELRKYLKNHLELPPANSALPKEK